MLFSLVMTLAFMHAVLFSLSCLEQLVSFQNRSETWFSLLMTHRALPGTRGSLEASRAAHLSTPEWEPVKSLGLCHPTATAPAPGEALERKEAKRVGRKNEREKKEQL